MTKKQLIMYQAAELFAKMKELRDKGWSKAKIGRQFRISKQRVHQIFEIRKEA